MLLQSFVFYAQIRINSERHTTQSCIQVHSYLFICPGLTHSLTHCFLLWCMLSKRVTFAASRLCCIRSSPHSGHRPILICIRGIVQDLYKMNDRIFDMSCEVARWRCWWITLPFKNPVCAVIKRRNSCLCFDVMNDVADSAIVSYELNISSYCIYLFHLDITITYGFFPSQFICHSCVHFCRLHLSSTIPPSTGVSSQPRPPIHLNTF